MTISSNSGPNRPTRGRRSKLTPEVQGRIATALRAGCYLEQAAQLAGISPSTLYDWLARGRKARSGQFLEFLELVQGAIAQAEVAAVAQIVTSSKTDWRAAAWLLERGPARARWRQSLQVRVEDLSDDEIRAALDEVARRLAGGGGASVGDDEEAE